MKNKSKNRYEADWGFNGNDWIKDLSNGRIYYKCGVEDLLNKQDKMLVELKDLFMCISEICVEASKYNITNEKAFNDIRKCLEKIDQIYDEEGKEIYEGGLLQR